MFGALILLVGQQTVYQFVRLFLIFFYQTVTKSQRFWIPNKFNASKKYKPSVLQNVHSTGCSRKKWTPKFFRCFLSNRLGF